jgi:hypothetical protein
VHHFDINMSLGCSETKILMDGVPLTGVHAFRIECDGNSKSRIILEIAGSATLTGDAQVWISDATQAQADKAEAAETRADAAEARADAAEAKVPDLQNGTLAYIVPVPQETRDAVDEALNK